jgi:hypothetical protein
MPDLAGGCGHSLGPGIGGSDLLVRHGDFQALLREGKIGSEDSLRVGDKGIPGFLQTPPGLVVPCVGPGDDPAAPLDARLEGLPEARGDPLALVVREDAGVRTERLTRHYLRRLEDLGLHARFSPSRRPPDIR